MFSDLFSQIFYGFLRCFKLRIRKSISATSLIHMYGHLQTCWSPFLKRLAVRRHFSALKFHEYARRSVSQRASSLFRRRKRFGRLSRLFGCPLCSPSHPWQAKLKFGRSSFPIGNFSSENFRNPNAVSGVIVTTYDSRRKSPENRMHTYLLQVPVIWTRSRPHFVVTLESPTVARSPVPRPASSLFAICSSITQ